MSLITKNNYEAFLLDYVEGNLSPEHTAELMLFFENHPELKEDLEEFDIIALTPDSVSLSEKDNLKIKEGEIGFINYEDAIISEIEGENSKEESLALMDFLNTHPEKKQELAAYQNMRLIAPAVLFENKADLKQKERKVVPLYWWYTAAAAVILALFLLKGINWGTEPTTLPIAEETKINTQPENNPIENISPEINNEENLVANEETNLPQPKKQLNKIKEIKQPKKEVIENPVQIEPEKEAPILANEIEPIIKDSSSTIPPINEKEEVVNDEILYADDVKIIYEDDNISTQTSKRNSPEKISKLRMLKEVFTHKVKDKMVNEETNEEGEVIAQAFNVGPFNFARNKR